MRTFTREEIYTKLKDGIVDIYFIKKDGSTRLMNATWNEAYLPSRDMKDKVEKEQTAEPKEYVAVWDISVRDWRSFRFDSVYRIDSEQVTYGKE